MKNKKMKKTVLWIILGVVVVCGIAYGAYKFGGNSAVSGLNNVLNQSNAKLGHGCQGQGGAGCKTLCEADSGTWYSNGTTGGCFSGGNGSGGF